MTPYNSAASGDVFLIPKISYVIRPCKFVFVGAGGEFILCDEWERQRKFSPSFLKNTEKTFITSFCLPLIIDTVILPINFTDSFYKGVKTE